MTISKTIEIAKIEVVLAWNIQVVTDLVIIEDTVEISRSRHRHVLQPYYSTKDIDGNFTHTATDISGEATSVQDVANAVWTDDVKAAYIAALEAK